MVFIYAKIPPNSGCMVASVHILLEGCNISSTCKIIAAVGIIEFINQHQLVAATWLLFIYQGCMGPFYLNLLVIPSGSKIIPFN